MQTNNTPLACVSPARLREGAALLQAVCEQPWDDCVRLVYADWLEEHGEPERAAFIRFQCEYPSWDSSHPQFRILLARDGEFDPFKRQWEDELPRFPGVKWQPGWFERGFINWVIFQSAKAFREHAAEAFAASPVDTLEVRRLTGRTVRDVLTASLLDRVWHLHLMGPLGDEGLRQVAACPTLIRVESLCIWGSCGDVGAEALAGCASLSELKCLSFSSHHIGDRGAMALAESPALSNVTDLVLHGVRGLSQSVRRRLKKRFSRVF
jgi:uncharacterized protein (TIGR02996 family)